MPDRSLPTVSYVKIRIALPGPSTLRGRMNTFRTAKADDGWFEVIECDPREGETVVFRHPLRSEATEWLFEQIRIRNMRDHQRWIPSEDVGQSLAC